MVVKERQGECSLLGKQCLSSTLWPCQNWRSLQERPSCITTGSSVPVPVASTCQRARPDPRVPHKITLQPLPAQKGFRHMLPGCGLRPCHLFLMQVAPVGWDLTDAEALTESGLMETCSLDGAFDLEDSEAGAGDSTGCEGYRSHRLKLPGFYSRTSGYRPLTQGPQTLGTNGTGLTCGTWRDRGISVSQMHNHHVTHTHVCVC